MAEEARELDMGTEVLTEEPKWEKWAGLEAVDLFSEKVNPQLLKLIALKELLRTSTDDFNDSRVSLGLYEILEEVTDVLDDYFGEIKKLYKQERPFRLAWKKSQDERKAKELLEPENLERIAETLSLEAEKFRTKAEEVRAEAPDEEVSHV